jgi:outer membrane protein OmpA-like peptidoglycan-associated protein
MNHNYTILISIFALSFTNVYAQERETKKLTHEKKHKMAHGLVTKGSYYNALDHLKDIVKEQPDNQKYMGKLADAYFFSRDYINAEEWYSKVIRLEGKKVSLSLYRYAETLKYNAKYKEAKDAFKIFTISKYKDNAGEKYKIFAKNEIESCEWAIKNKDLKNQIEVVHIGDHVNSAYSEFGPVLMNDSTLVFSSLQSDSVISVKPDEPHTFHVKLLASKKQGEEWGPHTELPQVNSVYESNANGAFSLDGKKFYFTRCVPNENNNQMICSIYVSEILNGELQKPVKLGKEVNTKGYTSTQPSIGMVSTGKSKYEVIYFSSNKPGGKGGQDLYYSAINKNGTLKPAVNLGNINTIRDEISPFYDKQGHLYFSSNFYYGFGGFDVFRSKGNINKWEKPINIGKPYNSRVDDTYFSIDNSTNEGFIVSNRPEGYHLMSETCCDDIYAVRMENPLFLLQVNAYNAEDNKKLGNIKLMVFSRTAENNNYNIEFLKEESDSLKHQTRFKNDSIMKNYLKGIKNDTASLNTLIDKSSYQELEQAENLYNIANQKEYLVYAIYAGDTAVFSFLTGPSKHTVSMYYRFDTLTNYSIMNNKRIDLVKVNLFFHGQIKDEIAMVKDTVKVVIEDEKQFTITKVIEDIRRDKKDNLRIILNYDFDDTKFIEKHTGSLDSLVTLMKEFPAMNMHIDAHTDNKGTHHYNFDLSRRRAKSIQDYLISKGIDKKRMTSKGHGETIPLVPNSNPDGSDNPENRWLNRRAEITIVE